MSITDEPGRRHGARAEKPIGTVTFLFTDIEGSTRLAQRPARRSMDGAPRPAPRADPGGDRRPPAATRRRPRATASSRSSGEPADAVRATVDAQRSLAAESWPDDVAVRVRMGLHTGEGNWMPTASTSGRTSIAPPGSPARATAARSCCRRRRRALVADELPDGVTLRGLGEHRLKDLRPERICQLDIAGLHVRLPADPLARPPAEQPAHPADQLRRSRGGAGRGRQPAHDDTAPDPHGTRRNGQDATVAPARRGRRGPLSGWRLVRRSRTGP